MTVLRSISVDGRPNDSSNKTSLDFAEDTVRRRHKPLMQLTDAVSDCNFQFNPAGMVSKPSCKMAQEGEMLGQ